MLKGTHMSSIGTDDTPLSISDAANAYAGTAAPEPEEDQTETVETEGDPADPDLHATDEEIQAVEGETVEGETEEEGQAEEQTSEELETERGRYVAHDGRVKLPDGSESTIADLIQGNLRDRDYRQKTMEASEIKRSAEAQSLAAKQQQEQLAERAEYVISLIKSIVPEAPDPSMADPRSPNYDPAGYMSAEAQHKHWMQHLNYLQQEQQRAAQERQAQSSEEEKGRRQKEWDALVGKAPELKDEKRLDSFVSDLKNYGQKVYGFKPEEIARVALDHRQALVLRDAMKWQKLQANKAKVAAKVEGRPPVTKGGIRLDPSRAKARDSRAAMDRLNQSGRFADGVAALLATENQG